METDADYPATDHPATDHPATSRSVRYVYYVAGRAKVHPPVLSRRHDDAEEAETMRQRYPVSNTPYTAPFEMIVRLHHPLTHDDEMSVLHTHIHHAVQAEVKANKDTENHLVGEVVTHNMAALHTILVDDHSPEAAPAKVLS